MKGMMIVMKIEVLLVIFGLQLWLLNDMYIVQKEGVVIGVDQEQKVIMVIVL